MTRISSSQLSQLGLHVDCNELAEALDTAVCNFNINSNAEIAHWIAQLAIESEYFTELSENLNYSAQSIVNCWPNRFSDLAHAAPLAHNPQALANNVYGDRMGNTEPNDGWLYRGRGFIQLTGKDEYETAGKALHLDLVGNPDQAATVSVAAQIAAWFWNEYGLGFYVGLKSISDQDKVARITKIINGGLNGVNERYQEYLKTSKIWK